MININTLNQNNNYSLGKPNITTPFSTLAMGETTTTTGNMGKLLPIFYKELQPSQTINSQQAINIQFTPFVTNLMHQIKGELISYFVPYRLIWKKWEDFVTGGEDGTSLPEMPSTNIKKILDSYLSNDINKNEIRKLLEKDIDTLQKRIENYNTQNEEAKKTAAIQAKQFGVFVSREINEEFPNPDDFLDGATLAWNGAVLALEKGYPYEDEDGEKSLLAKELNIYENVIQHIFKEKQWDYLGLPYSLAHFVYYMLQKSTKINTNVDYLDIKKKCERVNTTNVMTLPFRAYRKIYNDWIRLADWEEELDITQDDITPTTIEEANYDWDYFTRARRYQIRGAMPTIPVLGGQVFEKNADTSVHSDTVKIRNNASGNPVFVIGDNEFVSLSLSTTNKDRPESINNPAEKLEFNDIMTAAALMNYFSANARIRPRYAEHLLARWNVRIQDARLQLSEFIGINEINITSQGVVQTSAGTENQTQQGNITGQLWGNGSNMHIGYKAQEHGIIITFLIVKPANSYEQGYPAWMKKKTRFDLPTPEMVNLPDIAITSDEIDPFEPETAIIGYKAIYDEYRTSINKVTGLLRPSNSVGLASYTLARKLHKPTIETLTKCRPDLSRVKQYLDQPDFILITAISTTTAIPLPYTSDVRLAI